jgi:hypothetical protein
MRDGDNVDTPDFIHGAEVTLSVKSAYHMEFVHDGHDFEAFFSLVSSV